MHSSDFAFLTLQLCVDEGAQLLDALMVVVKGFHFGEEAEGVLSMAVIRLIALKRATAPCLLSLTASGRRIFSSASSSVVRLSVLIRLTIASLLMRQDEGITG